MGLGPCSRVSIPFSTIQRRPLLTDTRLAGLMTSISDQIYAALAYHVSSEAANSKRLRQVSFWGLQRGAEVLLDTLRKAMDPVYGHLATI